MDPIVGTSLISSGLGGIADIAGGLVGGRARRQEQREARKEYSKRMEEFANMTFTNPYENMQNTFEDLTVNQQEAQFLAQQRQQGLANTMGALSGAAGGSGIASLAQALSNQQSMNLQKAAASIGQQEARNQALTAKGAMQVQMAEAQGEQYVQDKEFGRTSTLLGMSQERLAAANLARQQATQQLVGGIGKAAGVGLMVGANEGMFGAGLEGFLNN
jgi:hypothetical protein